MQFLTLPLEIFLGTHAVGREIQKRGTNSQRRCGQHGNAFFPALGKHHSARRQGEKVEPINVDVNVFQELVHVLRFDTFRKFSEFNLRVDVQRDRCHRLQFGLPHGRHRSTRLSIQVMDVKVVKIRNIELGQAQARQCAQMCAAHTTQPRNGNARPAHFFLLIKSDPADVAGKGFGVIEDNRFRHVGLSQW